jgi:hypothetical protein
MAEFIVTPFQSNLETTASIITSALSDKTSASVSQHFTHPPPAISYGSGPIHYSFFFGYLLDPSYPLCIISVL